MSEPPQERKRGRIHWNLRSGPNHDSGHYEFDYSADLDDSRDEPRKNWRAAIREYVASAEGQQFASQWASDPVFTWGDAFYQVPDAILNKYAIYRVDRPLIEYEFTVRRDENFADELEKRR